MSWSSVQFAVLYPPSKFRFKCTSAPALYDELVGEGATAMAEPTTVLGLGLSGCTLDDLAITVFLPDEAAITEAGSLFDRGGDIHRHLSSDRR